MGVGSKERTSPQGTQRKGHGAMMEDTMSDMGRRPTGRLYCWTVVMLAALCMRLAAFGSPVPQSGVGTTTVADTVYMADGSAAQGSLIISWPAFVTASGSAVAAGSTSTTLGTNGALSVALAPNAGASPAGVYYTVVYQLGPGQVKTEYWLVPTTSPANLTTVRTTPGAGVAGAPVSMQYVNSALATKADDNAVVHLGGTETISGAKTFATAPSVPAPTSTGQVANKAYVDQSVSNVGAGNYLPTAGGTMTGPITLPANPAAPMQAATKQYVDTGFAAKADVIAGLVPANELGTGLASAGSCLLGNGSSGTWGACGGGGGTGNLSTNPVANQSIAQPAGTQFSSNNLANIRYVTSSWNWMQTPADNLATPGNVTIHLAPCPLGIDTSANAYYSYKVRIAGTGTAEVALVTGGACTAGASSGTIVLTTVNAHSAGYTVGSASSGIQEAWNDAWVNDNGAAPNANSQTAPYVKLVADTTYSVYASIYLRGRGGILDGAGALIACSTRDRCIYIGTTQSTPYVNHHKLYNLSGTSTVNVDGVQVSSASSVSGTVTINTVSAHPFVVGDTVDCEIHSQWGDGHAVYPVIAPVTATSFTVHQGSATYSAATNTYGFCNILNTFIEDNSDHVVVQDINIFQSNSAGLGYFTYGIVNDNDQQFIVERASNRSSLVLNATANWPIGAFLYERTDQGNAGITYLHNSEFTGLNCATGGGNGMVISDTVCQGFPTYGIRYFGGLQSATLQNIYQESTGGTTNPLYGYAAQNGYVLQGVIEMEGNFPASGYSPTFPSASGGSAAPVRSYFIVPRSSTQGAGPVLYIGQSNPGNSGGVNITPTWPSPGLAGVGNITFDLLVTTGPTTAPPTGTGNYALATGITFASACSSNGMCTYLDTQAAPASYTVPAQQYDPIFWFWPVNLAINPGMVFAQTVGTTPQAVASIGAQGVSIIADRCSSFGPLAQRSPIWVQCSASDGNGGSGTIATVLQQLDQAGGGPPVNSKGRLNFGKQIGAPSDLITLQDSNFTKTMATAGERPSNDAGDIAIGLDQIGGLAERSATSISEYINTLPSGTNYQERLTAAAKTFNVPVTVNGSLAVTSGTVTLPVSGTGSQCLHVSSTGVLSGTGADCGSGGGGSGTVNSGVTSQVAMYSGNGTAVSGDSALTDNGTTLNYGGSGGISAATGAFSGNLTVNGQLLVAGPWMVSSPIPGTAMAAAGTGTSALGISNDGNFYVSANGGAPQKVATSATSSYFSNLWQEDANDLGMYNGTTAQGLHVYSSYTNSSTWQRTSLGFDTTDNLAVVRSENSTSSLAPGLGFWIGSSVRWAIDSQSTLKPFANNLINIGTTTLAPQTIFAATSFDSLTQGRHNFELCNDSTTGTALNFLAVYNGATAACAIKAGTSNTDGVIGIVSNGSGTSGNAVITYRGYVPCSFDGSTVAGDFVVASITNPGDCHDAGATRPTGVQVLGRVESTNTGIGTYAIRASLDAPAGGGSGLGDPGANGIVVRNGVNTTIVRNLAAGSANVTITNPSGVGGNPTVDVNTSNLFSSPALTGTPTAPTAAANTNTTQVATTAFAHGVVPPDSNSSVWITVPHSSSAGTVFSSSASKAAFFGVILGFQKTTAQVSYYVSTADTSATTYDLGFYSGTSGGTCTLLAHTGSIAGSTAMTSGAHTVAWTGGSVTLQPGRYYLALTASATTGTAVLYGDSAGVTFAGGTGASSVGNVSIGTGGTLPATATCPVDSVQVAALIPAWLVN